MFAVTGGKGGVGKTTTALGLARALGERGEDVLVVDTDRDLPDLARTVGLDTVRVTSGGLDDSPGQGVEGWPGVRVLTAPRDSRRARRLLDVLADRSERVVLDCPAGAGRAVATPLRAADRSVVVSTCAPASVRDAMKATAMARTLDAPPLATVLSSSDEVATALARVVQRPIFPVPTVRDPLSATATQTTYREISKCATLRNC